MCVVTIPQYLVATFLKINGVSELRCMNIFPSKLRSNREQYAYPTIVWKQGAAKKLRTTAELDKYHASLLNSKLRMHKVAGVLSVIFWGHVSGKNGRINQPYAHAKVKRATGSSEFCRSRVAACVSEASRLIDRRK